MPGRSMFISIKKIIGHKKYTTSTKGSKRVFQAFNRLFLEILRDRGVLSTFSTRGISLSVEKKASFSVFQRNS